MTHGDLYTAVICVFGSIQVLYLLSLAVNGYFYSRWTDLITPEEVAADRDDHPPILLLYPVLREAEETMRTTLLSIAVAQDAYLPGHARVVAIPNSNDAGSIAALERLTTEFDFLEILEVPPTSDPSWAPIWSDWETNTHAYWWHIGKRRGEMALPPKKTRQLVYALYAFANKLPGEGWLLSYLDADSAVPVDYYRIAAAGAARFDVVQLTNVAGNLMQSWAASFHAMDHMAWDGGLYPHMTARGRHPFYVLGKGLFFRVDDLVEFGGFNPWLTIEDPEVGMRLWTNDRTLGVSQTPLIEEVPQTFRGGITQRKRWVAGFFQSLHTPLAMMGMSFPQRMRARLNLVPCLSLALNTLGLPLGVWVLIEASLGRDPVDVPLTVLCVVNLVAAAAVICRIFLAAWVCSGAVLHSRRSRLLFLLRVNPLFLIGYWILWLVPLAIGLNMFLFDGGLVWQRTEKIDANHTLIREGGLDLPDGEAVVDLRDRSGSRDLVDAAYRPGPTSNSGVGDAPVSE